MYRRVAAFWFPCVAEPEREPPAKRESRENLAGVGDGVTEHEGVFDSVIELEGV